MNECKCVVKMMISWYFSCSFYT